MSFIHTYACEGSFRSFPVNQASMISNMYPFEVAKLNPQLGDAAQTASQSMGTLVSSSGKPICSCLLVGIDRMLVPAHAVSDACPSDIKICFTLNDFHRQICVFKEFRVLQFVELNTQLDFCILQLSAGDDGLLPGNCVPIPNITDHPISDDFFLIHANQEGALVVSLGQRCSGNYDYFCSYTETLPGSSGGINFDRYGSAFAMHIARSTGVCGGSSSERKAIFLTEIIQSSHILSHLPKCQPLKIPTYNPICMPAIESSDPCMSLERHGTLQASFISSELIVPVKAQTFTSIINFLNSFNSQQKKQELYSKFWGRVETIYKIQGARLDRQPPPKDAANLQIQVENQTIATVLVSNQLAGYAGNASKIAEVVNYTVRKFIGAVHHAQNSNEAIVLSIAPIQ